MTQPRCGRALRLRSFATRFAWVVAVCAIAGAARSQTLGRIPVRIVAGKLVVACDVSSPRERLPVNLFVDYDAPCGLQLHNKAAFALKIETGDGKAIPLDLHFPDFQIQVPRREHGDEEYLEEFTKYHSAELGENAVVGVIGSEVWANYHVTFNLSAGWIELGVAREEVREPPAPQEGVTTVPISIHNGVAWMPVHYTDGTPAAMALGTSRFDTEIDAFVAEERGFPAGDIELLRLGDIDVTDYVALRPEEVVLVHPDGVAGRIGLNFLNYFKVELDRVNRYAYLTERRPASFPEQDLAFFRAMVEEDADAVAEYLTQYSQERLSHEAAELLLDLRLDEGADEEDCVRAVEWIHDTSAEDLRTTRCLDLMKDMSDAGEPELVLAAGELGVAAGRDDRYPNAVHEVHAKMGDVLLERGDADDAWRHLLSAAFGLPEDGMINLNLGRYYEGQERYGRAFSRFVQAAIQPESGPQAMEALERVQGLLPDEEPFSVDLVERMIAGKVKNFGAANSFEPDDETLPQRVVLVEFFTNAYLGDGSRGAIGGALGNQGLLGHFDPEYVAFLSYHVPEPQPDPLVNELAEARYAEIGLDAPAYHVIDGLDWQPGAARWRQAEAVYLRNRTAILERLNEPSEYELELDARLEDGEVRGELVVRGPVEDDTLVRLILAERGVLFPGKTEVVIHRMVARASLLGGVGGLEFAPEGGEMRVPFECSLEEIEALNSSYLDSVQASGRGNVVKMSLGIDPSQVRLVAYVQSPVGRVLQAVQIEPEGVEEARR